MEQYQDITGSETTDSSLSPLLYFWMSVVMADPHIDTNFPLPTLSQPLHVVSFISQNTNFGTELAQIVSFTF